MLKEAKFNQSCAKLQENDVFLCEIILYGIIVDLNFSFSHNLLKIGLK